MWGRYERLWISQEHVRRNKHSLRAQKQPVYPSPSQTEDNNADRQRENKPVAKIDQLAFWVKSAKVTNNI